MVRVYVLYSTDCDKKKEIPQTSNIDLVYNVYIVDNTIPNY